MYKDVGKRVMALLLSLCMIAGMVDWSGLTVRAEGDRYHITRVTVDTSYSYTGNKIEPQKTDITVKVKKYDASGDWHNSTEEDLTDAMGSYKITGYGTNTKAGARGGTVTVTGEGNVEGTETGYFDIAKLDIERAECADIGTEGVIYVTEAGTYSPPPVLTYEYDSDRFLSLTNNVDYTCAYEGNTIAADDPSKNATITITGKGNYEGTKTVSFKIQMLDVSKLKIELKTGGTLRGKDAYSGGRPWVEYTGTAKELDKTKDVVVSYEGDTKPLDPADFVLEYDSNNLTSAGVVTVKARAVNGKYAGITTAVGAEYMITKWLDNSSIQVKIKDQAYPGKSGTIEIDLDDSENGVEFIDSDARDEIKNKQTSEKIEVEVPKGWETNDADENGIIKWFADFTAKNDSGYKGELRNVPFNIVAPSLSNLKITINEAEYDDATDWLTEIEKAGNKLITVGDGVEYVQGRDYTVKRKISSQNGKAAGTYKIVISPIDGGKLRPGSVEKDFIVNKKSLSGSGIQITVNSGASLTYNGAPHHPLPEVYFNGRKLTNDTDYTLEWENATNATTPSSLAKVKVTGKGNFRDTATREFEIQPLTLSEKTGGTGNAIVREPQNNVEHIYTGKDIEPEVDISVELTQTDGTIVTEKLGKADYTVTYTNSEGGNEHKNVANSPITMTISGTGNYKGDITREFTIAQQTINEDIVSIDLIPDQTYTGDSIRPVVSGVKHSQNGSLSAGNDYTVTYGTNTEAGTGAGTVVIHGEKNYKGTATFKFNILKCDIGTATNLSATADGIAQGQIYDLINDDLKNIYYPYDGKAKELPNLQLKLIHVGDTDKDVSMTKGKDYEVSYDTTQNVSIGTVDVTITGTGNNFTGTRKLQFRIKGNLTDMNPIGSGGRTTVTIPDQIYNAGILNPKDVIVTFRLDNGEVLELKEDDFTVVNKDQATNPTPVGKGKIATITGQGDYYGGGDCYFNVIKLNLTTEKDRLEEVHKYLIDGISKEPYIYSGLPITPKPAITHNGRPVELGADKDYTLGYYKNGTEIEDLTQPFQVGTYSVRITGGGDNYEGFKDEEYTVERYDISASYADIEITGDAEEVVLDDIKFSDDVSSGDAQKADQPAEMGGTEDTGKHEHGAGETHSEDEVVWKKLKVTYKPVGIQDDSTDHPRKELVYGVDYTVEYANNKTLGTATYTIKGKGNFTGEITKEFKILGDLGGKHTTIEAEDCTFMPATSTEPANKTKVTVTYTHTVDGREERITFDEGVDYQLEFRNNDKATHPIPGKEAESALNPGPDAGGQVIVKAKVEDGKHTGRGSGDNSANPKTFKIFQRDISEYGEGTDLTLTGLDEEGYEYNGQQIIPDLKLTCKEIPLAGQMLREGETPTGEPDYIITAKNNIDVWTDSEEDESKRVWPEYTVAARTDDNGLYNGNYCGKFSGEFQINPRIINKETIDTNPSIENEATDLFTLVDGEWECNYTRSPITFPKKDESGQEVPGKNGLIIKWSKGGVTVTLEEGKDYTIGYEDNTKIGKAIILVNTPKKSNYIGEGGNPYEKYFKIKASIEEVDRDVSLTGLERYMELEYDSNVPFDLPITYPDLQFKDISGVLSGENEDGKPYILEKDKDYVILTQQNCSQYNETRYSTNNVNVTKDGETATIVVKGIGYYTGVVERTYKIVPKNLNDKGIVLQFVGSQDYENFKNAYIFNGNEQEPEYKVFNNSAKDIESMETETETEGEKYNPYQQSKEMELGVDFEFVRWENNVGPSGEKGPAKLVLRGKEGGNYTGEASFEFNIVLRQMESLDCKVTGTAVYNGLGQEPAVEVSYRDETGKTVTLDPETDFDIAYANNINVPAEDAEVADLPTITLTGKGGYEGEKVVYFDIEPRNIADNPDITVTGVALYDSGNPVKPSLTVKDAGVLLGVTLDPETDYYTENQSANAGVGEIGTIDIVGKGNYTGTITGAEFRIIPPNGVLEIEEIPEQDFVNRPIQPKVQVNLLAEGFEISVPLTEDDYEVTYTDNLKAGTATVKVTGKYPFEGTATQTFTIRPKSISQEDGTIASGMALADIGVCQYTGSGLTPKVTLTFTPPVAVREGEEDTASPVELVQGRDYTVSYDKNIMPGKAKAVITGMGNYVGSLETEFEIHADMSKVTIAPIPTQDYTGSAVTPLPVVSLGGQTLTLDADYRITYSNNVDRGTATITITGIEPWYIGTRTVNFDIARELSSETSIRGVAAAYTYTGAAIAPPVRVEDDGNLLVNGVDYTVTYSQNVDAGTATITITGMGKYTGSTATSFKINPQQLGRAKVSSVSDQIYNGQEQNPPITVTSGDKTLENGKDYTLVYVNSATPGMASVIVKGEGNYTGTQTVNYKINVPGLTGVKFSKYTNKSVTITWDKNSVVTGYEIYNAKNRRAVRVNSASTAKGTVTKLKAGTAATFRVRAYVNKDGQYYYGPFTSVKTATAPNSTKISSLTSKKAKQVAVKWKKVSGATQYEVYRSTKKKGTYKKIATTKKTSYTDKKATGGKKYYYKIRVCKKISSKNYYSSYSAVKSVKAKK